MTATVSALYRYPLKSAGGERLSRVEVDAGGIVGDRSWAVLVDGEVARAKHLPELAGWVARLSDDELQVDDGDGFGPGPEVVGRHVPGATLDRADAGHRMAAPVHLISEQAALAPDAPSGCDPHPRANIVISGVTPGIERTWVGQDLRVGEVVLRVTQLPRHCLGVYAEVRHGGVIEENLAVLRVSKV